MRTPHHFLLVLGAAVTMTALTGCEIRMRMYDSPKFEPLEKTDLFGDNRASRNLVDGTVPRGHLNEDAHLHTGKVDGADATTFPWELTRDDLVRGKERYEIYCGVCHGLTGHGNGMIVQRGFKEPRSYHDPAFVGMPVGYYFGVASNGFGEMNGYADQVSVEDRWRIVAYIRALQRAQDASPEDAPEEKHDPYHGKHADGKHAGGGDHGDEHGKKETAEHAGEKDPQE